MDKIIYSKRIAYGLRTMGFKILKIGVNPYRPELNCYTFAQSDELDAAMGMLINDRKKEE